MIVPSLRAPILTSIEVALVGPEARNTSSRVMTSLTGRPALRDSASATGSAQTWVLPPKPPPISDEVTRSFETSMPEQLGAMLAVDEMALRADPEVAPCRRS